MGLIGDLFPALDVPRKRDLDFEKMIKKTAIDIRLQPEEGFVLKVVQLEELFAVRHSVFIIGYSGINIRVYYTGWFKSLQNKTCMFFNRTPCRISINKLFVTNNIFSYVCLQETVFKNY